MFNYSLKFCFRRFADYLSRPQSAKILVGKAGIDNTVAKQGTFIYRHSKGNDVEGM